MRHLFLVHAFLGEFDLALKAFDSYVEIITKGKARAEKSGEAELDIDDDEVAVRLAAEAIRISCRYGSEVAAAKALNIGNILEKWLEKVSSDSLVSTARNGEIAKSIDPNKATSTSLSPATISLAYRSIGICQCNYARLTYEPAERAKLQSRAIENLERSLELESSAPESSETLYALALVLAEKRDISGATRVVRLALAKTQEAAGSPNTNGVPWETQSEFDPSKDDSSDQQRKLLPVWHLLILLLCAQDDLEVASASCNAAFEQFGDMTTLFGQTHDAGLSKQSLQLQSPADSGIVDRMDIFEKQVLLEIKMTQVSLLEVSEGSEIAVNDCRQLLALYARLFGKVGFGTAKAPRFTSMAGPPKSASGTIRSKLSRSKPKPKAVGPKTAKIPYVPTSLPDTSAALASRPTTKSGPDGRDKRLTMASHERLRPQFGHEDEFRQNGSIRQAAFGSIRSQQSNRQFNVGIEETSEKQYPGGNSSANSSPVLSTHAVFRPPRTDSLGPIPASNESLYSTAPQALPPFDQNMSQTNMLPSGGDDLHTSLEDAGLRTAPVYDIAVPSPQFGKLQERRHKVSLLVKVWLFVAGIYGRASRYEDARQAVDEANTLVTSFELDVSKQSSSVKNFQDQGWGKGQSVDHLWADVFTEVNIPTSPPIDT